MMNDNCEAYEAGYQAARRGEIEEDNPYIDLIERNDWLSGLRDGQTDMAYEEYYNDAN